MTELAAVLLGGALALAGGVATSLLERRRAREERIWNRRAELYVDLIRYQGGGMVEGYRGPRGREEWAVAGQLSARAAAFASDAVQKLWQDSARASRALSDYVAEDWPQWNVAQYGEWEDVEDVEAQMEQSATFQEFSRASQEAAQRLIQRIREELGAHRS
ncbi:hypothetical protein KBZ21_15220 [Streptomyces sp. A73]|nr:hypothetical protein [Streptomyces sp. A73]